MKTLPYNTYNYLNLWTNEIFIMSLQESGWSTSYLSFRWFFFFIKKMGDKIVQTLIWLVFVVKYNYKFILSQLKLFDKCYNTSLQKPLTFLSLFSFEYLNKRQENNIA